MDGRAIDPLGRLHRNLEATADSHSGTLSGRRGIAFGPCLEGTRNSRGQPVSASSSKASSASQPLHARSPHSGQGGRAERGKAKPRGASSHLGDRSRRQIGATAIRGRPPRMERKSCHPIAGDLHRSSFRQTKTMGGMEARYRATPADASVCLRRPPGNPQNHLRRQLSLLSVHRRLFGSSSCDGVTRATVDASARRSIEPDSCHISPRE